jgi:hypothetical protein
MASLMLKPQVPKTSVARAFKSSSMRQRTVVFNNMPMVVTKISWIPRPVFQPFKLAMNISLIPFLLENRRGSTQEIAERVEL